MSTYTNSRFNNAIRKLEKDNNSDIIAELEYLFTNKEHLLEIETISCELLSDPDNHIALSKRLAKIQKFISKSNIVNELSMEHRKKQDILGRYFREQIEFTFNPSDTINVNKVLSSLHKWICCNYPSINNPAITTLTTYVKDRYPGVWKSANPTVFNGVTFSIHDSDDEEEIPMGNVVPISVA